MNDHERKLAVVKRKLVNALDRAKRAEHQLTDERERADALAECLQELEKFAEDSGCDMCKPPMVNAYKMRTEYAPYLAQRDARVAAEAIKQWRQDRKDLILELTAMQNMTHVLARSGGCSSEYPNDAKAVLERVTGGHSPFFEDQRADEIAAGGGHDNDG